VIRSRSVKSARSAGERLAVEATQRRELLRIRDLGTYGSAAPESALNRLDAVEVGMNVQEDGGT
jgi:hypothetical protein